MRLLAKSSVSNSGRGRHALAALGRCWLTTVYRHGALSNGQMCASMSRSDFGWKLARGFVTDICVMLGRALPMLAQDALPRSQYFVQ
jgi:hypothetical protein